MHPTGMFSCLITGRNEVLAKVIFSQVSVIHSVHRGGGSGPRGSSKFGGGLVPGGGGLQFWGVLQIFGGFSKFWGGLGFSKFSGGGGWGSPNFGGLQILGGFLQIFRAVPLNFRGCISSKFSGEVSTRIWSTFGWYASYWNAFLLSFSFSLEMPIIFFPRKAKQIHLKHVL